ncbi:MAG: stage V sporulation protein B [Clostridia bacterium]|nr:stage V sporulation protein B [Clostridia bacterium]
MSRKSFIGGTVILMLAGFVVRILGFVYRIYLANLIGAEGLGLFQLISPVYSLIILTLTSGVSIAVSKMVAEEYAKNHIINLRRITYCALVVVAGAGVIVSGIMFAFMDFIVDVILKDSRTYYSMIFLLPCIPVIAAASAIKGYFYGMQDVVPTAISQIVEQIVRIGLVMAMAGYFLNIGLEYACALAVIGMAFGEISNLLVVYIIYIRRKGKETDRQNKKGLMPKRRIVSEIIKISIPVSLNRFINGIMYSVEQLLIPNRLQAGGMDLKGSLEEFGRLTGMAMPLLFFPSVITSALATTLVPAISESISTKSYKTVNYRISRSVQLTFILGFIFTAIFLAYPDEIGNLLYKKQNIGSMLYMLSFTCIFMYVQSTLLGILNGLGMQGISLQNSVIGSAIRIGFVYFYVPLYGVKGYVWGVIISSSFVCILNLYYVTKTTGMSVDFRNWVFKPGIVGIIMFMTGRYIYSFFTIFIYKEALITTAAITGNIAVAIALMVAGGVLDKDELLRLLGVKKREKT